MFGKTRSFAKPTVLETTAGGTVLELVLQRKYIEHSLHDTSPSLRDMIEGRNRVALVINLLRLEFVDGHASDLLIGEIVGLCAAGLTCCIVATGTTARSLTTVLEKAKITDAFGLRVFADLEEAVWYCRQHLLEGTS